MMGIAATISLLEQGLATLVLVVLAALLAHQLLDRSAAFGTPDWSVGTNCRLNLVKTDFIVPRTG